MHDSNRIHTCWVASNVRISSLLLMLKRATPTHRTTPQRKTDTEPTASLHKKNYQLRVFLGRDLNSRYFAGVPLLIQSPVRKLEGGCKRFMINEYSSNVSSLFRQMCCVQFRIAMGA